MSSETSTDAPVLASGDGRAKGADAGFQAWQLFTLAALISASAIAFLARNRPSSVRVALILTVFGAAAMGVAALRALLPLAKGAAAVESTSVGGRTRAALEREKTLALRTIKELEFDRAMGKVSDKDFTEMSGRLRARAVRILSQLDADPGYRDQIEGEIARRLGSAASAPSAVADSSPSSHADSPASTTEPIVVTAAVPAAALCQECGTGNDTDARFCKACGHRLGGA